MKKLCILLAVLLCMPLIACQSTPPASSDKAEGPVEIEKSVPSDFEAYLDLFVYSFFVPDEDTAFSKKDTYFHFISQQAYRLLEAEADISLTAGTLVWVPRAEMERLSKQLFGADLPDSFYTEKFQYDTQNECWYISPDMHYAANYEIIAMYHDGDTYWAQVDLLLAEDLVERYEYRFELHMIDDVAFFVFTGCAVNSDD